jgi:hypothetical protein
VLVIAYQLHPSLVILRMAKLHFGWGSLSSKYFIYVQVALSDKHASLPCEELIMTVNDMTVLALKMSNSSHP